MHKDDKAKPGEALKRDWEQTKNDFNKNAGRDLDQDVGDTLGQATGTKPTPPRDMPNPPELDKK